MSEEQSAQTESTEHNMSLEDIAAQYDSEQAQGSDDSRQAEAKVDGQDQSEGDAETKSDEKDESAKHRDILRASETASKSLTEILERDRAVQEYRAKQKEELDRQRQEMDLQRLAKENPVDFLKKFGHSEEDVNQFQSVVTDPVEQRFQRQEAMLEQLMQERNEFREQQVELQKEQEMNLLKEHIGEFLNVSDDFPLTRVQQASHLVVEEILKTHTPGQSIKPEQLEKAAQVVESDVMALTEGLIGEYSRRYPHKLQELLKSHVKNQGPETLTNGHASAPIDMKSLAELEGEEFFQAAAAMIPDLKE